MKNAIKLILSFIVSVTFVGGWLYIINLYPMLAFMLAGGLLIMMSSILLTYSIYKTIE